VNATIEKFASTTHILPFSLAMIQRKYGSHCTIPFCQSPYPRATTQDFEELKQRLTSQSRTLNLEQMMADRDTILGIDDRSSQSSRDRMEDEQYPKVEGEKD
jgi:hypothetical protein